MKHVYFVFLVSWITIQFAEAQVDCANIGFELASLTGWSASSGLATDQNSLTVLSAEAPGVKSELHYITSLSNGNDPKVAAIPMVAPGSTHSIRLGNTQEGGDFSRIKTNYLVTADNTLFQYKFAVILQNTNDNSGNGQSFHEPFQKPGFNILIYDSNGDGLPCSDYDIQLQGQDAVDGFVSLGDIQYRTWTTGAIDLRNYIGKNITIVVTSHGCTRKRHFGYAYFDAQCLKSEIRPSSQCPDADGLMTLNAPDGFGKYAWSTGETTPSIKVKAKLGDDYHVKLVPLASLDESCALQLGYTITYQKTAANIEKAVCDGEAVTVGDTVYRTSGTFIRTINKSNVCDSTVTLKLTVNSVPRYTQNLSICSGESVAVGDTVYTTSGTFIKKIPQSTGCDSIVTTNLLVKELDLSVAPEFFITQGDSTRISVTTYQSGSFTFQWLEAEGLSCPQCAETWAKPLKSTAYVILVTDTEKICARQETVKVLVKPCGITIPDAFSPNDDSVNEVFFVYGNSCVKQIRDMMIYNRWGQVIYQKENFAASDPANGWPGTYHGLKAAAGSYPYKIRVELKNGSLLDYKGALTLIR